MTYARGMKAENFFSALLNKCGIEHDFVDEWYDYLVKKGIDSFEKVEVKSCQISVKNNKKDSGEYTIGRFDFTSEENREKQFKHNVWIALIVRHREQFIMYGLVKAKDLNQRRYLTLHAARKLRPISFEDWLRIHIFKDTSKEEK